MITDDLTPALTNLIGQLSGPKKRALARAIGMVLRANTSRRIAAQKNPDGSAFEPKKLQPQAGKLRQKKGQVKRMFPNLRKNRFLKIEVTQQGVSIGFDGPAARIAHEHQYGLRTPPLPARRLLGVGQGDEADIMRLVLEHLARG